MVQVLQQLDFAEDVLSRCRGAERLEDLLNRDILLADLVPR